MEAGLLQTNKLRLQNRSSQKRMKFQDSLLTETTKQSLIPTSLCRPNSHHPAITVFAQTQRGLLSVSLPLHSAGVEQLVEEALQRFNRDHLLQLPTAARDYFIFAARRSGRRYSDYPAIEPTQNALLTKITYYYLKPKKDVREGVREGVKSVAPPQTQIGVPLGKRAERKPKEGRSCFCLF